MSLALLTELLALPGVQVVSYELPDAARLLVNLVFEVTGAPCPTCGELSQQIHSYGEPRTVRDLDVWHRACYVRFRPRQFMCARCHTTFVERLSWLGHSPHHTHRWEQAVYLCVQRTNIADAARQYQASYDQVAALFAYWAEQHIAARGYPLVKTLHVDEIAPQKGHGHYRLILSSPTVGVLDVLEDRLETTLDAWLVARGAAWCAHVTEFNADMWRSYHTVAARRLPNAHAVADHFHVIKNANAALQEVRKVEQRALPAEQWAAVQDSRWWLARNRADLTDAERTQLDTLLADLPGLRRAYELKEALRRCYALPDLAQATTALAEWLTQAATAPPAFQTVVTTIKNWQTAILNFFVNRGNNGFAEGINTKIKLVLRRAFGCANFAHLRLRIIVAFCD